MQSRNAHIAVWKESRQCTFLLSYHARKKLRQLVIVDDVGVGRIRYPNVSIGGNGASVQAFTDRALAGA